MSLGLFALNIPLLCLALMFEYWQTVYNQYDHLQRHTRFANMMFIVEYLCVMMTIFGAAVLFADAHWILGLIFFISTYFACWLYVAWSDSLSTNRHTT
ncbi:MAG: hypothetical protein HC828_03210 [Blastochloris sp.]|nr:hypothetical protein [Blastochloris sp.]